MGLESTPIEVEVDIPNEGLPAFNMVGLPDKAVEESKERVRSAIKNSGADLSESIVVAWRMEVGMGQSAMTSTTLIEIQVARNTHFPPGWLTRATE